MSTTTTNGIEQVKFDLEDSECSTATVSIETGSAGNGWAKSSTEFFLSADAEERKVWVNIRTHTYIRIADERPLNVNNDIASHRFTEAEARALLATLVHELAKLD
jgi:hypothetical protein